MTATSDREAALAMLRERFPESEGWVISMEMLATSHGVCCQKGGLRLSELGGTYALAARDLIAAWDAATHAEQVRALVEAAEKAVPFAACAEECVTYKYGSDTCDCGCESATRAARAARAALAALPASLRGKGGGRG